jgi:hypothetical protein
MKILLDAVSDDEGKIGVVFRVIESLQCQCFVACAFVPLAAEGSGVEFR